MGAGVIYHLFHYLLEGRHYAYENPLFRAVGAALTCGVLVIALGPWTIRKLLSMKVKDRPMFHQKTLDELMSDKKDVPTMGGILIVVTMAAAILLWAKLTDYYVIMGLVCLGWLAAVGFVDDYLKLTRPAGSGGRDGLTTREKLLFQVGIALILGYFVYAYGSYNHAVTPTAGTVPAYRVIDVPFYKPGLSLGLTAFVVIAVLVMTGTSNAVNLTDGLDGLAAGCLAICALVFLALAYVVGTQEQASRLLMPHIPHAAELAVVCGAMFGSLLGFLWYNCHPAQVFMGDTGSLPLGGVLGYVAVVTRQELMLLVAGGVFVVEALSVMLQVGYFKYSGGQRIFRCAPLHHHFQMGGWGEPKTVVRFWLLALIFAGCALGMIKLR